MNLEELLADYRDLTHELSPALAELKQLKSEIREHVLDTGELAEIEGAKISVRRGGTRTTWNGKMLEGFEMAHPEIGAAKTVKKVGPSVVIKVD